MYDIKNEQRESKAAHVGTVSQTVRSGNESYKEKYHARPSLLTVFSTTQLEHSIRQFDLCHHGIEKATCDNPQG